MRATASRFARRLVGGWLLAAALGHAWLAWSVTDTFSTTADEIAHLTGGANSWFERDHRLHPENGLLPQRWAAWPATRLAPPLPTDSPAWARGDVWSVGDQYFHRRGNDVRALLSSGRAMIALLSGALVLALGCWSWQLGGPGAAMVTSTLAGLSPTLLAHGGLATSDTAAALGFIVATGAWWRLLHRITLGRIAAAGAGAAALALSKYSAGLFPLIALLLLGARLLRRAPVRVALGRWRSRLRGAHRLAGLAVAGGTALALAIGLIWAAYGFRYEAAGPRAPAGADFVLPWSDVLLDPPRRGGFPYAGGAGPEEPPLMAPGIVQHFVRWARSHEVLPEAWLYGFAYVDLSARQRPAFFAGEWRLTGWRTFFPVAYVMKSTGPELALHFLGVAALAAGLIRGGRMRRRLYRVAPLVALLAVYGGFSILSPLNIGHRHILPVYAALAVLAGLAWAPGAGRGARRWRWAVAGLLAGQAAVSTWARPDYLAYFNLLAGGPPGAHRYFVDSSLDWGQDLPRLKTWIDRLPAGTPVFLSYFGSADPIQAGLRVTRVGDTYSDYSGNRPIVSAWRGGWFVISATMWQRVYTHVRGPWTSGLEQRYQELRRWAQAAAADPGSPPAGLTPAEATARWIDFEHLRFGRLCFFLRHRPPDERVGATFLAFRLSDGEVAAIQAGPLPWAPEAAP